MHKMNVSGGKQAESSETHTVIWFSDIICAKLQRQIDFNVRIRPELRATPDPDSYPSSGLDVDWKEYLERIQKNGSFRYKPTEIQKYQGRNSGCSVHRNCFICRKYLLPDGGVNYHQTSWRCKKCQMPLCMIDRKIGIRTLTCIQEHLVSHDIDIGCYPQNKDLLYYEKRPFPRDKQVQLIRKSDRIDRISDL